MAHGFGGGGTWNIQRLKQFPPGEVTSHVRVILPFGIPGLNGVYEVQTTVGLWTLVANSRHIPPKAIEPHLEGYTLTVDEDGWVTEVRHGSGIQAAPKRKIVSLDPDRWGRSWRTELFLSVPGVLEPGREEDTLEDRAAGVLEPCCVCINRVLDGIVYVGGPSWLPPVTPADFWFVEVDYRHGEDRIGFIQARGLHTFWWRGPRPFDESTRAALRDLLRSEAFLPLHEELVVTATRKRDQGDYRGAVIDSICAVESILAPLLEAQLQGRGISKSKAAGVIGPAGLGLADQVHVLLPLVVSNPLSERLRKDFAEANGKRNRIVHRGEGATLTEAQKHLQTCRDLIEFLTQSNSQPAA